MSQMHFQRPNWIIHDQGTSWSGKYEYFLGHHYHEAGKECWIIAAYNIVVGSWTERHFNLIPWQLPMVNTCVDPKAEALTQYEVFKSIMERAPEYEEETEEWSKTIRPFLERERGRQGVVDAAREPHIKIN